MIYFDNAATTFPKPPQVIASVNNALKNYGANPGRGGHRLAMEASAQIYACRKKLAEFFGAEKEENVVFTLNCTEAVNIVLKGYLKDGDHVVVSSLEHNSVIRPLTELAKRGISYSVAKVYENDNDKTVDEFRKAINADTKLIACTQASNVWGIRVPVERIAALAHEYGIKIMVDAAQTAGVLPINVSENKFDFLCCAGHKGLMGPMGTGVLITPYAEELGTLKEGGTGSDSILLEQPEIMPDKLESGTPNLPGIAGLLSGVTFVKSVTTAKIYSHEEKLIQLLYEKLSAEKKVILYTAKPYENNCLPILSFNVEGFDSETVAQYLNNKFEIAVRAGLHCAPFAHRHMDTLNLGAVRVSPSYYNNISEINKLCFAIHRL